MKIYRNNEIPDWLGDFVGSYKEGTMPADQDISYYSTLSNIISGERQRPYNTVSEAVDYYKKAIGLNDSIKTDRNVYSAVDDIMSIVEAGVDVPDAVKKNPKIETFIRNMISDHPGIQLAAIINSVLDVFSRFINESDLDDDFYRYVNEMLMSSHQPETIINDNVGRYSDLSSDIFESDVPLRFMPGK